MKNNELDNPDTTIEKSTLLLLQPLFVAVEIFKTNVQNDAEATRLLSGLNQLFPGYRINFDLQDCDKILRIAGEYPDPDRVTDFLTSKGYFCQMIQ